MTATFTYHPTARPRRRRDADTLEAYVAEVARFPLLTAAAEKTATPTELANHNLRYALALAKKHRGPLSIEDALGPANEGLWEAARLFDGTRGCRFTTFSRHWILKCIRKARYRHGSIWIPIYAAQALASGEDFPTAEHARTARRFEPLEDLAGPLDPEPDDGPTPADRVEAMLARLPEADADLLRARWGIGRPAESFRTIAKRIQRTHQTASDRHGRAINAAREMAATDVARLEESA